jgi:hypothetical protein
MFGAEMKPLMDAAKKFAADTINDQIEDAEAEIAAYQRKIKRLKAKRTFFDKFVKEMSKPPKPFKFRPPTKAERKRIEKLRRQMVPSHVMVPPAVGM